MITQLELETFKCFRFLRLALGPLTLLSGTNAAGKSTILQSLVLLHQTMQANEWSTRLMLNGSIFNLGRVTDMLHQEGRDRFGIGLTDNSSSCRWTFAGNRDEMSLKVDSVEVRDKKFPNPETLQHLLPPVSGPAEKSLVNQVRNLTYISAEREGPREFYPLRDPHRVSAVGPTGENAVSLLFRGQDERIVDELLCPLHPLHCDPRSKHG